MSHTNPSHAVAERPLTDFHTYYRKKIRPYLLNLEQRREDLLSASKAHARNHLLLATAIGIALAGIAAYVELFGQFWSVFAAILFVVPPLVMRFWLTPVMLRQEAKNARHEAFYSRYKSKVVESMVRFFDASMRLQYEEQVSKDVVRASQLVQDLTHIDIEGDDFVSGQVRGLPVYFSELRLTNVKDKEPKDIFHGIFFSATLKKSLEGALFIVPKAVLPSNGWGDAGELMGESPLSERHRCHNIKVMEQHMANINPWNPAFSDYDLTPLSLPCSKATSKYVVYATKPAIAQKLMTMGFCQNLLSYGINTDDLMSEWSDKVNFRKAVNEGSYISIIDDRMAIMQPQGGELFEPDMEQSFLDEESLSQYHDSLCQVFNMMEGVQEVLGVK